MMPFGGVRPARKQKVDAGGGLEGMLATLQAKHGLQVTESVRIIPPEMTFRAWCEKLGREGLKVDGKPFKLDDRPAMAWIYDQVPTTVDDAYNSVLVLMKCAQVGFTVLEMLAAIYHGVKFGPATVGMFLPDMSLAGMKSTERFMPIVRSIPAIHASMTQDSPDGTGRKTGEGNVNRRRIDRALFVFSWTSGRSTTESIPMDILSFDEVQEMTLEQMEKTVERLSASEFRYTLMGSTANWPDADIHHWYKRGSQYRFHTECPTCGARKPLDDYFPDCIRYDPDRRAYRYVCEAGHWIDDTQLGAWIPDNLEAGEPAFDRSMKRRDWPLRIRSIHFPQFLSPTISAGNIMQAYNDSTDRKNFFNRKLGKPWLDPSEVPVTLEHMANCVAAGKAAGVKWKKRARGSFMGIDQMGAFNVVIIKERLPDGRMAVIHLEEIYSDDPFRRCDELMEAYGVQVCVVEVNPNYNDAQRFAKRHNGKVFLCNGFASLPDDMVKWGDAPKLDPSERRTDEEMQTRYTVKADQFKCMQASLARFTSKVPFCLWPDPQELVQEVIDKGVKQMAALAPRAFVHFTKTALSVEKDEETNKFTKKVRKVGVDPHHSYANQLCDVAWARAHGTATFILPTADDGERGELQQKAIDMNAAGLPTHVVRAMQESVEGDVCGRCEAFPVGGDDGPPAQGVCSTRNIRVGARDACCPFFIEVE